MQPLAIPNRDSGSSDSQSLGSGMPITEKLPTTRVVDEYDDPTGFAQISDDEQQIAAPTANSTDDTKNDAEIILGEPSTKKATPTATLQPPGEIGPCFYQYLPGAYKYRRHLSYWSVAESATDFWSQYGQAIATKNLWISIGNLTLAFSVWIIWSIVIVLLFDAWDSTCNDATNSDCFYSFSEWKENMSPQEYKSMLLILPATSGLSGATLRITNSFMIAPCGGPIAISQSSILLLVPMVALYVALNNTSVDFITLIIIAVLTGAGGGAFCTSMSNITLFYPKSKQGLALALNAGIGNLGVSLMQILVPAVVSYAAFGKSASIYIEGVGYIANSALIWVPFLCIFIILSFTFMNSLPQHENAAHLIKALVSFYWLELIGYAGAIICVVILITTRQFMSTPGLKILQAFILWIVAVLITVLMMKYLMCFSYLSSTKQNLNKTFTILSMKHTWIMSYLYTMTFGSFIGFSASFPALIKQIYPDVNEFAYAWLGPFVGSVFRPFGGWLSDKFGGARITHWTIIAMIGTVIAVGLVILYGNESLFPLFLVLFLILFVLTGIGNASTFRMVPIIFTDKGQAGPVLGWMGAIAAYGAFVIPIIFGASIQGWFTEWVFFAFAIWYLTCGGINWWYYHRSNAEVKC